MWTYLVIFTFIGAGVSEVTKETKGEVKKDTNMEVKNWCDEEQASERPSLKDRIENTLTFHHHACYFMVSDIKHRMVKAAPPGEALSLEEGNKICKEFNATLATIHSSSENAWVSEQLGGNVLLGARVQLPVGGVEGPRTNTSIKPTIEKWDDGLSNTDFVPPIWWYPKDRPSQMYTVVAPLNGQWETIGTKNFDETQIQSTIIPCKQNLTIVPPKSMAAPFKTCSTGGMLWMITTGIVVQVAVAIVMKSGKI